MSILIQIYTDFIVISIVMGLRPYGEVFHDFREGFQFIFQFLEGNDAAVVLIGRLKQSKGQVIQLLLRQRDGTLKQTRLNHCPQLIWINSTISCSADTQNEPKSV